MAGTGGRGMCEVWFRIGSGVGLIVVGIGLIGFLQSAQQSIGVSKLHHAVATVWSDATCVTAEIRGRVAACARSVAAITDGPPAQAVVATSTCTVLSVAAIDDPTHLE